MDDDIFSEYSTSQPERPAGYGDDSVEKESYSKSSLRAVERIRERGAEYGIVVPYLRTPLSKDRSSGIAMKVMTGVSLLLVGAALAFLIWALVTVVTPLAQALTGVSGEAGEAIVAVSDIPLIGALLTANVVILWAVIVLIPVLLIAVMLACARYALLLFRICRMNMEEKAAGFSMRGIFVMLIVSAVVALVLAIVFFAVFKIVLMGVICVAVIAYLVALYAVLCLERGRAKQAFAKLPAEAQSEFTEYFKTLENVKRRHRAEKASTETGSASVGKLFWLGAFLALILSFAQARMIYTNLKNNPVYKDKSTGLARRALANLAYFVVFAGCGVGSLALAMYGFSGSIIFKIIFFVAVAIFFILAAIVSLPKTISYTVKQLKLNKRSLGYVALGLLLLSIVAVVVAVLLVI